MAAVANAVAGAAQQLEAAALVIKRTTNPALKGIRGEVERTLRQVAVLQRTVNHIPGA